MSDLLQIIQTLRPAGNIAYNMSQGIESPNPGGAPYEFNRIRAAIDKAIADLTDLSRRSPQETDLPVAYTSQQELEKLRKHPFQTASMCGIKSDLNPVPLYAQEADWWRPIETAPKDGTKFDAWQGGERVTEVYWSNVQEGWCVDGLYGPSEPAPLAIVPPIAHWRPLPAAPQSTEGK